MSFLRGLLHALIGAVLAWEVLALAHLPVLRERLRWPLAVVFALFCIWAIWWTPRRSPKVAVGVLFLALFAIWASIHPSLNRPWRPEVAVMPRVTIDGDSIRITGVRNFDCRSTDDFTVRYEEREYRLSQLRSVDFFLSYWQVGPVGHTFSASTSRTRRH